MRSSKYEDGCVLNCLYSLIKSTGYQVGNNKCFIDYYGNKYLVDREARYFIKIPWEYSGELEFKDTDSLDSYYYDERYVVRDMSNFPHAGNGYVYTGIWFKLNDDEIYDAGQRKVALHVLLGSLYDFQDLESLINAGLENNIDKIVINHKDNNPLNNNRDNLEWCFQQDNVIHSRVIQKIHALCRDELNVPKYTYNTGINNRLALTGINISVKDILEFKKLKGIYCSNFNYKEFINWVFEKQNIVDRV